MIIQSGMAAEKGGLMCWYANDWGQLGDDTKLT